MCVGSLDHLDNCKACLKIVIFSWYVRSSLPFISRFISILKNNFENGNQYIKILRQVSNYHYDVDFQLTN